jgi:hypothetical protein
MAQLHVVFLVVLLLTASSSQDAMAARSLKGEKLLENESNLFMILPKNGPKSRPSCGTGSSNISCP